jgi:hypothetical protein
MEDVRKGCRSEYGRNIMYSCMKMEKIRPIETILRMGRGKIKEIDGAVEFNYDISEEFL